MNRCLRRVSNYPKTLSSPGFYGGYTPFSDSYRGIITTTAGPEQLSTGRFCKFDPIDCPGSISDGDLPPIGGRPK